MHVGGGGGFYPPPARGPGGGEGALFINKAATLYYYKIGGYCNSTSLIFSFINSTISFSERFKLKALFK